MFVNVVAPLLAVLLAVASGGLLGGLKDVDLNRDDVQNALQFAVAQHNKASNDVYVSQVAKVISAQTQSQQCQLKVWSQPWTNTIKVVKNTCL
ncbi:Cystatin [Bagarius yarrelli]|uniref:Cystatin n=1 Tax=Bagarius yarrelli TaxID=175774 RepID=A0A556U773_BAGYA|nr:Cystatin [Bagarius yarrelli]